MDVQDYLEGLEMMYGINPKEFHRQIVQIHKMEINEHQFNMITRNYNPSDMITKRIRKKKTLRRKTLTKNNDSPTNKYGSSG